MLDIWAARVDRSLGCCIYPAQLDMSVSLAPVEEVSPGKDAAGHHSKGFMVLQSKVHNAVGCLIRMQAHYQCTCLQVLSYIFLSPQPGLKVSLQDIT